MTTQGQAIVYENIDDDFMACLFVQLHQEIELMSNLVLSGKEALLDYYTSKDSGSWKVNGEVSAAYFGTSLADLEERFPGHCLYDVELGES